MLLCHLAMAQLSGTITVPGTYPTLAATITALNTSGVSGPVVVEVSANETAPTGGYVLLPLAGSSAVNNITIKAIGAITLTAPVGTSTSTDGVIKLSGADFVTIDGFTIAENSANTTATTQMEWGIAVLSASATNSSQNVTIKNCSVNLNGTAANTAEIGIYAAHHGTTTTTAMTPTAAAGTYANLKITGCTINNAYTGISIGISGSASFFDANITVGETGAGNTITNFGGGATQAYGIRLEYGTNANIGFNTVDNTGITTHTTTLDGIYTTNGAAQNLTVTNNLVKLTRGSSTSQLTGIRNLTYTGTVNFTNNEITGFVASGTGVVYLIQNTGAAASLNISGNNIRDNVGIATTSGVVYCIFNSGIVTGALTANNNSFTNNTVNSTGTAAIFYNTSASNNVTFSGNTLTNNGKLTSTTGTFYGYWNSSSPTGGTETITNNIINGQGSTGFAGANYGIYSSTSLTQSRITSGNTVTGMTSSGAIYGIYLLSSNNNSVTNNKVTNINQTGTGAVYGVYTSGNVVTRSGNRVSNLTIGGSATVYPCYTLGTVSNVMSNDTVMDISGTLFTCYTFYVAGSSTSAQIDNNFAQNLNGVNTFGGLYLTGTVINAYSNTIRNVTGGTTSTTGTVYGVYISNASSNHTIYNNRFDNFTTSQSTTGSTHALFISTAATVNAYGNTFRSFTSTAGTTSRLNSINFAAGTTVNVYNNLFTGFSAGTSTDGAALNAILVSSTAGTFNFYNNTFRLTGTLATGGATGIFFNGTGATINCINNIFDVDVTATDLTRSVALIRKATAAGAFNYAATSNNNISWIPNMTNSFFYIEGLNTTTPFSGGISPNATPITGITDPGFNTACSTTKALLGGRDALSFYEQITFNNNVPSGATFAESGGQLLALVTVDLNGTARTNPPDCGAYEFSGTASTADVSGPTIIYTNISNSICNNFVPFAASITDASGVRVTSNNKPRVWYKKTTEANVLPPTNTSFDSGWKYVEASNNSSPFTFAIDLNLLNTPAIATDIIQYFVVASDNIGNVSVNQAGFKGGYCAGSVALDTAAFPLGAAPVLRTFSIISPPSAVTTVSSKAQICSTDQTTLSMSGDPITGAEYQWQSSPTLAGTYIDIPGANAATYTVTINSTSDKNYQCVVKCGGSVMITSTPISLNYYNPLVASTIPATRCGSGSVDLQATPSTGATIDWYTAASGGSSIFNGNTFTTPNIATTTTYYAEASEGGTTTTTGRVTAAALGAAATLTNYGLQFTLTEQIILNSVDVFSGTGTAITVSLYNANGTTLLYTVGSVSCTAGIKNTIPLNWTLPAGTYRIAETAMTGTFYRESGTGISYPIALGTSGQINGYFTSLTGANTTSTTTYYYFYNFNITTGCRSPRIPVVATITTPPTISMPADLTVCSNDPAQGLSVSSNNPGYTYEWGPSAGLNTTTGAVVMALPPSTTLYVVTATDNSGGQYNGCQTTGSVKMTVNEIPSASLTKSTKDTVCFSEIVNFSLINTGNAIGLTYQWQSSPDGVTYTDITGATNASYNGTVATGSDTWYQCKLICKGNLVLTSSPKQVFINAPGILTSTGATRCGTGSVDLTVTTTPGANVFWYNAATGGTAIGSGTTFTTPAISATRDFYVSASSGGSTITAGMQNGNATGTSGAGTTNYGIVFDVLSPFTLKSVKIYPISATSLPGVVTIDIINSAGTIMHTKTVNVVGSPIGSLVPTTVDLDFNLVPGTNYKMRPGSFSGITGLQFEPAAGAPGGNYGYPMVYPGVLTITTSTLTAAPTNTARNDLYYYFYNWVVSTGCESPRLPVTATVTTADPIAASPDVTICSNGTGTPLSVTSSNASYTYSWGPSTGLSSTTGATVTANPAATTSYYVTATDPATLCGNIDTVKVTVNQVPLSIDIKANLDTVCFSDNVVLSLINGLPSAPSGLDYQWQSSANGTLFTDISGATSATATVLVDAVNDKVFRCNLTCLGTPGVISSSKEIYINAPSVTSTTGATRCGAGAVNLTAAAGSPNETLSWYANSTGGTPLGFGSSFTTPVITASTDFYVSSNLGGGGLLTPTLPTPTSTYTGNVRGMWFTAPFAFKIKSLKVPSNVTTGTDQSFAVVKFNAAPPAYSTVTNAFTVLYLAQAVPGTTGVSVNIPINAGDIIGIMSQRGNVCSYGPTAPTMMLGTTSVPIARLGMQFPLNTTAPKDMWTEASNVGLTEFTYAIGCESPRTAISAIVTPAPAFTVTTGQTICNNGVKALTVTSNIPDYDNYSWNATTNLYSNPAATVAYTGGTANTVYFRSTTAGAEVINATAFNSTNQCANIADLTMNVLPSPTLNSSRSELCLSGTSDLKLVPTSGYGTATFEWYDSANGTTYNLLSGASSVTLTTPVINSSTYYKARVYDDNANLCGEPVLYLPVNNPFVVSTQGASACPSNSVTLSAVPGGAGTIRWFDVATGGSALQTGNTYTTPVLGASKTYYVESVEGGGGTQNLGLANRVGSTTNSGYSDIGLMFDAISSFTLESVSVYPVATTPSGNVTATIALKNSAGTILQSVTVSLPTSVSPGIKTLVPLNFNVPVGTGHRLVFTSATGGGISGFIREVTTGYTYPYTVAGVASITSAYTGGASSSYYYYFYDWKVTTSCASPRVPVVATINSCPRVNAKVFLSHADPATGLMSDYIKTLTNFPTSDPYSVPTAFNGGFTHLNNGPTGAVSPATLAVTGNNAIVDWVFLELRQGPNGATSVTHTQAGLIQKDGDIVGTDGVSPIQFRAPAGNYYLTIRHRNHLGFRTQNAIAMSSTPTTLNLTNNSVLLNGAYPLNNATATIYVMVAGDANSDGSIDSIDTITWEQENGLFDDYILNSDYNLDGSIDAIDSISWESNNGKYQELD